MTDDRELVMAYIDGELDAAARGEFEARLASDLSLRTAVQREQALRQALAAAYDPVLDEPLPAGLQAALRPATSGVVFDLAGARAARQGTASPRRWRWPEWGAMAACLLLGVVLGLWGLPFAPGAQDTLVRRVDRGLVAHGALAQALTESLAADASASRGVAVGLSFMARDGHYCRSFAVEAGTALAGLACRADGAWQLRALMPAPGAASAAPGAYRMAASALPPALLQLVDALRDGEMFDTAAERAARERGWQP